MRLIDKMCATLYNFAMKYNFLSWWLSVSVKPLPYKIWKFVATPILFVAWVLFIAVYREMYWQFSLYAILPAVVIDLVWDGCNFFFYRKKLAKKQAESCEQADIKQD
ncbi:MAG: hypothetical protein RR993_00290 [Clostridia bacterium]